MWREREKDRVSSHGHSVLSHLEKSKMGGLKSSIPVSAVEERERTVLEKPAGLLEAGFE